MGDCFYYVVNGAVRDVHELAVYEHVRATRARIPLLADRGDVGVEPVHLGAGAGSYAVGAAERILWTVSDGLSFFDVLVEV